MTPVILIRASLAEQDELEAAKKHFPVYQRRSEIPKNSLVIGRYSVLPYHKELEDDVTYLGSKLINSTREHSYVADLQNWYHDIYPATPKTWFKLHQFKQECRDKEGSFVVKGNTNSLKHMWNTHMFAPAAKDVDKVFSNAYNDTLVGSQDLYIREFVPLRTFRTGIRDLPVTEEYRFFVLDREVMGGAFYWSEWPEVAEEHNLSADAVPKDWLQTVIDQVSPSIRFFVVDVGRKQDNTWTVIELNDGCMSGISMIDPNTLYYNLSRKLL